MSTTSEDWDAEDGSFTYDPNGNLKTAPAPYSITSVTYDHRNLPLSLTSGGVTTTYRYDHAGQRITKRVGTGSTEVYLIEGATPLAVFTVDAAGTPTAWHFNVIAGGRVVGRAPHTGGRRYYHTDLLGSTRAVVEGASVLESYDYDPWGVLMPGRTLAGDTKEGFTGKERDAESGLDYFGARLYMAALGRWTTVDPPADSFPEWNPYNYALNNPVGLTDPFGLSPCDPPDDPSCRAQELLGVGGRGRAGSFAGLAARGFLDAVREIVAGETIIREALGEQEVLIGQVPDITPGGGVRRGSATVRLFRSVSQAELDDIERVRAFRQGANALRGKWFATTAEHAAKWGELLGNPRIVQVEMPADAVEVMMRVDRLDNIGPAVYAELDQLLNGIITVVK